MLSNNQYTRCADSRVDVHEQSTRSEVSQHNNNKRHILRRLEGQIVQLESMLKRDVEKASVTKP